MTRATRAAALFGLAMATPADAAARSKVLFWDTTVLSAEGLTNGAKLNVNRPEKLGRVISPESAWELAEVGGYDTVIQMGPQDYLFYYLCNADYRMSPQRVCLARSVDGLTWTKPDLGVVSFQNSTANNLVWVSVCVCVCVCALRPAVNPNSNRFSAH